MAETAARRSIVVGVDGSASATQAVGWAAREAVRRELPLLVVHSCALVPVSMPDAVSLHSYREAVTDEGRRWLAAAAAAAHEVAPDVQVNTELASGWAAEQLIARSASAELVVLGSRGLGGFTGLLVGSTAVAVTTHAHCPVIVVRGTDQQAQPSQDSPVVVGVDGSPTSSAAVRFAFAAAASRGVPVVAVHTWSDLPVGSAWQTALTVDWELIQAEERQLLDQWLADCRDEYPDVPVERVVARDRPAHALLERTRHAQLAVVGSRGRGGFRGLLLGSTSQALIYHAACPVAMIPPLDGEHR